jgi:hypothetical protein
MTSTPDFHERTRLRIHIASGRQATPEEIRDDIDRILSVYLCACAEHGMEPDDYTLERGEIARGA